MGNVEYATSSAVVRLVRHSTLEGSIALQITNSWLLLLLHNRIDCYADIDYNVLLCWFYATLSVLYLDAHSIPIWVLSEFIFLPSNAKTVETLNNIGELNIYNRN